MFFVELVFVADGELLARQESWLKVPVPVAPDA